MVRAGNWATRGALNGREFSRYACLAKNRRRAGTKERGRRPLALQWSTGLVLSERITPRRVACCDRRRGPAAFE